MPLILKLSILDACMHWKHTCVYRNMQGLVFSHKPCPLSSSQDHPRGNFPGPSQLQKLNQFQPVLVSGKNLKNLKFSPFCTNFTHFYFEFLKIFIFSESMDPQDHYGTHGSRIQDKCCPQEMVVSI